jgi:chemotaxis protein histidine kinase CheA
VIEKRKAIKQEWEARLKHAEESVPKAAYDLPIETLGLSESVQKKLLTAEYDNVGDLMLQMFMDPEKIREISGIGPKAMKSIEDAIEALTSIMPEDEEPEPEAETEAAEEGVEVAEGEAETEEIEVEEEPAETEAAETPEETPAPEAESPAKPEAESEEEESPESLDEIFTIRPELLEVDEELIEEEEIEEPGTPKKRAAKKKKKKPKKFVDVEYDPDQDVVLYRKRHKRDGEEWTPEDDWDL